MRPPTPLSVLMPAYNEEEAIASAVQDVQSGVLDRVPGAELIVVDDGSRDATGAVLDGLSAGDTRIRVIHQANSGHGGAVRAALDAASGERLFLIDSDRQIPLDGFAAAWSRMNEGADGVFGVRRTRHDAQIRLWLSRVIRVAVRTMFGVDVRDANVPYKLLRRAVWEDARDFIPPGTLAPSLFLAVYAQRRGYNIVEVDVPHKRRDTGQVSIRRMKLAKFCAKGFRQMIAFRRQLADVG